MLTALPPDLLASILQEWLPQCVIDLSRLDVAFCNHHSRKAFLEALRMIHFAQPELSSLRNVSSLPPCSRRISFQTWLETRQVRIGVLCMSLDDTTWISDFSSSPTQLTDVTTLMITSPMNSQLLEEKSASLLFQRFPCLTTVDTTNCEPASVRAVLQVLGAGHWQLTSLRFSSSLTKHQDHVFHSAFRSMCTLYDLSVGKVDVDALAMIAECCPSLRSLQLALASIPIEPGTQATFPFVTNLCIEASASDLVTIRHMFPAVAQLRLLAPDPIEAEDFSRLLASCAHLRHFVSPDVVYRELPDGTEIMMRSGLSPLLLSTACRTPLRKLYGRSDASVLRYLRAHGGPTVDTLGLWVEDGERQPLEAALSSLPLLRDLTLTGSVLSDALLERLPSLCPTLRSATFFFSDAITDAGVVALAQGYARLDSCALQHIDVRSCGQLSTGLSARIAAVLPSCVARR